MQKNTFSFLEAVISIPSGYAKNPLHPLTYKILGLTIIERNLRALEKNGIEHVTFLLNDEVNILQNLLRQSGEWSMSFAFTQTNGLPALLKSHHQVPPQNGLLIFFEPTVIDPRLIEKLLQKGQQQTDQAMTVKNKPVAFLSRHFLKNEDPEQMLSGENTFSTQTYLRTTGSPLLCRAVKDNSDVRVIEKSLIRNLTKPNDGWVSRHLNRPISTQFSRLLAHTNITPNQVTLVLVLPGLLTGLILAKGGYWGFLVGGALFHLTSILDGVDGEMARLKFKSSLYGKWLDFMCDNLAYLAALVGFLIGLFRDGISPFEKMASLTALTLTIGMMTSIVLYYKRFNKDGKLLTVEYGFREGNSWFDRLMQWAEMLGKRDWFALIFFLLAVIGKLEWALVYVCLVAAGVLAFSFEAHARAAKKQYDLSNGQKITS